MLREEEKDEASSGSWKTYSRSMSWTECPPRKTSSKPLWNSKARACLPPLQPLCIVRPSVEEWPKAGSDDIGIWTTPSTPSAANPGSVACVGTPTSDLISKNRHALFDKECSKVLDHVYLGCNSVAKDREILHQNGITHVLNCVGYSSPEYFKNELVYKTLWLQDCPSEDITSVLYDVFDYFEEIREQGGRVLVHCCRGVSRSTSLVIAYLMWKQGMSFTDAFQKVKAARGVADPNVGFACQLMQCQKRVHALPPSPNSLLRIYRVAPHSPYDPLHLVPKMVCEPGKDTLDSRGAFLVMIPSAIFIWIGKQCPQLMSESATRAANQAIRYERAKGPAVTVKEKEESLEFGDAFNFRKGSADVYSFEREARPAAGSNVARDTIPFAQRKVDKYDSDFEIFHNALAGGVVPPLLSGSESEICLPIRESRWIVSKVEHYQKDAITPLKVNSRQIKMDAIPETQEESKEHGDSLFTPETCKSSRFQRVSPNSAASYFTCSSNWNDDSKEPEFPISSLSRSPSFSLVESFASFYLHKHNSSSPSSSVSPSASDYSSTFTFSPSSSNCSDFSPASASASASAYSHHSPYRLESRDTDPCRNLSVIENVGVAANNSPEEPVNACDFSKPENLPSRSGEPSTSLYDSTASASLPSP